MKLENQVCTLEQARKFDELGLKLDSYFVWTEQYGNSEAEYAIWIRKPLESILKTRTDYKKYSAYSCAELGVLLPATIITDKFDGEQEWWLNIDTEEGRRFYTGYDEEIVDSKHEAHAKADLFIYLLKEKIINPETLTLED